MNILFFDILITGHHTEYITHIMDYLLVNANKENNYYFVVHQSFSKKYPEIWKKPNEIDNIYFIEASAELLKGLTVKNRFSRSLNNFRVVDYYTKKYTINICYFLYFNTFQIALGLKKTNYQVRGILFMQFTNMKKNTLRENYYYYRRYFPLLLCLKNINLDKIFILNDKSSCNFLNNKFKKQDLFAYLPDPIPQIELKNHYNIREEYGITSKKKIFLLFGSLSERKGVLETIQSTIELPFESQKNIVIFIAGKTKDQNLIFKIKESITTSKAKSNVQIVLENGFVENDKMASLFQQTDFVLLPYKNPEGSSGILGHAMKAFKPVIGTSKGLVGKLINKFKMGCIIEDITPKEIANAISQHDKITIHPELIQPFLNKHSVTNFAKTLLCDH